MSGGSSGNSEYSLDADDLLEIRERLEELRKEKEMLGDSKFHSFELIKKLELQAKALSKYHQEDKQHIADLERQLCNCNQEIDYLQDQVNTRNSDVNCLGKQVRTLQLKLADMENLNEEMERLREQINKFESEKSLLKKEIVDREDIIQSSTLHIKRLEEMISSMALEYQCEIEGTKLESLSMEQYLLETKKLLEERDLENSRMNGLIHELELQIEDANMAIESSYKENRELKEKLRTSDLIVRAFVQKVEELFHEPFSTMNHLSLGGTEKDMGTYGDVLGPLFTKLAFLRTSDADLSKKVAKMSCQIDDYEILVEKLKAELREEKSKAKEEAEDLAQEMAELRYHLTSMLDEECKRRASIEQISLQRIGELEAQIAQSEKKLVSCQDLVVRKQ